jgi:hypothetical protein
MPVVLLAVEVYVKVPDPWQRVELAPDTNTGVVTDGLIVTVCDAETGPLHPDAVAVITDVPVHPAT